ncbi:MAG: His/Gly/Thr/Pro-type tRNA ligase C-terminal domain-containing protein, partial [Dehalococcoidia bacterium]
LGGRPTPGVGFAVGMERVILNLKRQGIEPPALPGTRVFVAYVGEEAKAQAMVVVSRLVQGGVAAMLGPAGKSLKAQLRQAGSMGVPYVLILGDQELEKGVVVLRDMTRGEQREVGLEELIDAVKE